MIHNECFDLSSVETVSVTQYLNLQISIQSRKLPWETTLPTIERIEAYLKMAKAHVFVRALRPVSPVQSLERIEVFSHYNIESNSMLQNQISLWFRGKAGSLNYHSLDSEIIFE